MTDSSRIESIENHISRTLEELAKLHLLGALGVEVRENTPNRVQRMWKELLAGYQMNPKDILSKKFEGDSGMVTQGNIKFCSTCEHHLVPFFGRAVVSYIPQKKQVVGISKLVRIVECYARRLSLQERMTGQIADALEKYVSEDCGVYTEAIHSCMIARGVKQPSITTTTAVRGLYASDEHPHVKQEFQSNIDRLRGNIL